MTQSEVAEEAYEQGAGPGAPIPVNQLIVSPEVTQRYVYDLLTRFLRVSLASQSEMSSLYKKEVSTQWNLLPTRKSRAHFQGCRTDGRQT